MCKVIKTIWIYFTGFGYRTIKEAWEEANQ
jgi:hypothetical protein